MAFSDKMCIRDRPNLDYSKYGTFGQNSDPACFDAINNLSPENLAVFRGTAEYKEQGGEAFGKCAVNALFGEWPCPYEYLIPGYCVVQPGWDFRCV